MKRWSCAANENNTPKEILTAASDSELICRHLKICGALQKICCRSSWS